MANGKKFTELTKITTPTSDDILAIYNDGGVKGITLDDLLIPRSVEQANRMPRIAPKTMTYTEFLSYVGEVADEDFTHIRLGDYVTFGNNKVIVGRFRKAGETYGVDVPLIDLIDATHHDGYGYGTLMNSTATTEGGFVGTKVYKESLPAIDTELATYFGSYLATTKKYLTNAMSSGYANGGSWYDAKSFVPNEAEIMGIVYSPNKADWGWNLNIANDHEQWAIFKCKPELTRTGENYWLRSICSATFFARVNDGGNANSNGADDSSIALRVGFSVKCTK